MDRNLDYYFHEVTHFYQASVIGERLGQAPCWFPEGAAMLIGYANSFDDSLNNLGFVSQARNSKLDELRKFLSDKSVSEKEILKLLNDYPASDPMCQHVFPQLGYGLGWFVNERIVFDFGWDRYLTYWRNMALTDWETAFNKSFSVTFSQWSSEVFAPYMIVLLAGK
jgi:hypothetical protein